MSNAYNESQKSLTTTSILESLLIKMAEKPLEKISISEVCTLAGVSRMAFYRHFENLSDVLSIHLEERFEKFVDEIGGIDLTSSYQTSMLLCNHLLNEKDFYQTIIHAGYESLLYKYFENFMIYVFRTIDFGYNLEQEDLLFYASYRAGGIIQLIIRWINQDLSTDPKQIAKLLTIFDLNQST